MSRPSVMSLLLQDTDLVLKPVPCALRGSIDGDADTRDENVHSEVTDGGDSVLQRTQAHGGEGLVETGGNTTPSWLSMCYRIVGRRTFLSDLSDDCLQAVLLVSQDRRAFLAFACACRAFRKLVTEPLIEEWKASPLGVQAATRASQIVQKRQSEERRAAMILQAKIWFPVGSRLSYFWACDGASYTGRIVLVNLRAKGRYAAVRFDENVGPGRLYEHRILLGDLARNAILFDSFGQPRAPIPALTCDFMNVVGCSCVFRHEACKRPV